MVAPSTMTCIMVELYAGPLMPQHTSTVVTTVTHSHLHDIDANTDPNNIGPRRLMPGTRCGTLMRCQPLGVHHAEVVGDVGHASHPADPLG